MTLVKAALCRPTPKDPMVAGCLLTAFPKAGKSLSFNGNLHIHLHDPTIMLLKSASFTFGSRSSDIPVGLSPQGIVRSRKYRSMKSSPLLLPLLISLFLYLF